MSNTTISNLPTEASPAVTDTLVGDFGVTPVTKKTLLSTIRTLFKSYFDTIYSAIAGSSSITTVGALNAGSITSGFGSIDVGTDSISGGAGSLSTLNTTSTSTGSIITAGGIIAGSDYQITSNVGYGVKSQNGTRIIEYLNTQVSFDVPIAVTGALSASGGVTTPAYFDASTPASTGFTRLSLTNAGGSYQFGVNDSTGSAYGGAAYAMVINAPSGRVIQQSINSSTITSVSSTGLAVTGTGSFVQAGSSESIFRSTNASTQVTVSWRNNDRYYQQSVVAGGDWQLYDATGTQVLLDVVPGASGSWNWYTNGVSRATLNNSGLAVTGALSSTGALTTAGLKEDSSGNLTPGADNAQTLGSGAKRWSTVYAGTGTINTSDAREKTTVRSLTTDEINAAKQLSKEIGAYQFLSAVAAKGDAAREHIGMTVQRAIEVMVENNLAPMNYGFICYDKWDDVFVEHPAIEAVQAVEAVAEVKDGEGNVTTPAVAAVEAVEAKAAWTEQTQKAGDRYAFRMDELLMFISRGIEARLAALEAN